MNEQPADRVLVNLTSAQVHAIDQLRALGYGDDKATPASVIEYVIARFIDDLKRAGVVKPCPSEHCKDRWAADAQLIAAAPDMLEAIEQVIDSMGGDDIPPTNSSIAALRAAYAKATGRVVPT